MSAHVPLGTLREAQGAPATPTVGMYSLLMSSALRRLFAALLLVIGLWIGVGWALAGGG